MATDNPYYLFIPNKTQDPSDLKKGVYGTDMRTIERVYNSWQKQVASDIAAIDADIDTIINTDIPAIDASLKLRPEINMTNWLVGGAPPAGTQYQMYMGTVSVTFTAGAGSISLGSFFNYGYSALATAVVSVAGLTYNIWQANCSLGALWFEAWETVSPFLAYSGPLTITYQAIGA